MNCRLTLPLLNSYVDGELAAADLQRVSDHLAECPACAQQASDLQTLQAALTSDVIYHHAPGALRDKVVQSLAAVPATSLFTQPVTPKSLTVVMAGIVGMVALAWIAFSRLSQPAPLLCDSTLSSQLHAVVCNAQTQFTSADPLAVKKWLSGNNCMQIAVHDLSPQKFTLVGARIDQGEFCLIPVLVYSSHGKTVCLYHYPPQNEQNRRSYDLDSPEFQLVHWKDKLGSYWAVSDMSKEQLSEFATLFKNTTGSRN